MVAFLLLGTVSAIWENPIFTRMTPVSGFEHMLLGAMSVMSGVYVTLRRQSCSVKGATTGSVLGFLGVACPVCNKVLLLAFGSELLLTYFEPVRLWVGVVGVLVIGFFTAREWTLRQRGYDRRNNA